MPTDNERMTESSDAPIFPASLAITAIRDSGYRDTAHALAELIDNSQQAGAKNVDIVCVDRMTSSGRGRVPRIAKIAVIDDGTGMDSGMLRQALQYGNGSHLGERCGIGRFGVGLIGASISQAGRLDVWTWRNGPENAIHSHFSIREIVEDGRTTVPRPRLDSVPRPWRDRLNPNDRTGTVVVWSELDFERLSWVTADYILRHTRQLASRIYRRFMQRDGLKIWIKKMNENDGLTKDEPVTAVDPTYLTVVPTLPEPYRTAPMFEAWGEPRVFAVNFGQRKHEIRVRYSKANTSTIEHAGRKIRGNMPYGKHALWNRGVSLVRADRELILDTTWCETRDTGERWWGVEVDFPPTLDEVFGVTKIKQDATRFVEMASLDWRKDLRREGEQIEDTAQRLIAGDDMRGHLLVVTEDIRSTIGQMRKQLKEDVRKFRHVPPGPVRNVRLKGPVGAQTLAWDAPERGWVTGYEVQGQQANGEWLDTGKTLPGQTDVEVASDAAQAFLRVRAANDFGHGPWTSIGKTVAQSRPLKAVRGIKAQATDHATAVVTWEPPADSADGRIRGYEITKRRAGRAADAPKVLGPDAVSTTETGLMSGAQYTWTVRPKGVQGLGPPATVSAMTPPQPPLGDQIAELVSSAKSRVLLCAPFVKRDVFERILDRVPDGVPVRLVTRWEASEVAYGATDLEVFDVAKDREHTKVELLSNIHTKLFVADEEGLYGSPNLTRTALGWTKTRQPNVESLGPVESKDKLDEEEKKLAGAVVATTRRRDQVRREVENIREVRHLIDVLTAAKTATEEDLERVDLAAERMLAGGQPWFPCCTAPQRLYDIHQDRHTGVGSRVLEDGKADLDELEIVKDVSRERFVTEVRRRLEAKPSLWRLLAEIPGRVSDERGHELIARSRPDISPEDVPKRWAIMRDWLETFFSDQYEIVPASFVVQLRGGSTAGEG